MVKDRISASSAPKDSTRDQKVLEEVFRMSAVEAESWVLFLRLTRQGKGNPSSSQQDQLVRDLRRRSMVPLEGVEDLPPHVVGRVTEEGKLASIVHSFDLENLVEFPEIFSGLLPSLPVDNAFLRKLHAFVDTGFDYRYLRRLILHEPELARKVVDLLRQVVELDSCCANASHLLLDWYQSQGQWTEAAEEARRFRNSTVFSYEAATLDLAEVLSLHGKTDEAVRALDPVGRLGYSNDFAERIPYLQAYYRAREVQTLEDAALLEDNLEDFFATLVEWMKEYMPGLLEDAIEQYAALPGVVLPTPKGTWASNDPFSLFALLYLSFAFRSKEWPDPPAEMFACAGDSTYAVSHGVDESIHRSRRGLFRVTRRLGETDDRALVQVHDFFTGEILKVLLPYAKGAERAADGSSFRAQLVPWQGVWIPRGTPELLDTSKSQGVVPVRTWFADIFSPLKGAWVPLVTDASTGLVMAGDPSPYLAGGPLVRALGKAHQSWGFLPEVLITREGFPFTDPTGRTAGSWQEPRVASSIEQLRSPPQGLRTVSLLKPWVETWGIRHISNGEALDREMASRRESLSEFLKTGKIPSHPERRTEIPSNRYDLRTGHIQRAG